MRQARDLTFLDILNNLRVEKLTKQQNDCLNRIIYDCESVRVLPRKQFHSYNPRMTVELEKKNKVYKIDAVYTSMEAKPYGQKLKQILPPDDSNETVGIHWMIKISSDVAQKCYY